MKCPACSKPVDWKDNAFRPFCSERCKLLDLGKWVSEEYRVPGKPVPGEHTGEEEGVGEVPREVTHEAGTEN